MEVLVFLIERFSWVIVLWSVWPCLVAASSCVWYCAICVFSWLICWVFWSICACSVLVAVVVASACSSHDDRVAGYLHALHTTAEAGDLRRGALLRTLCEQHPKAVAIGCYADGERDLVRLIDEEMRAAGMTIAADARATLVPLLGGDRAASLGELRKLALYARGSSRVEGRLAIEIAEGAMQRDHIDLRQCCGDVRDRAK